MGRRSRLRPRVSAHAAGLGAKSRAPADRATRTVQWVHYLCRVSPRNSESNLPNGSGVSGPQRWPGRLGSGVAVTQSAQPCGNRSIKGLEFRTHSVHFVSQRYPGHKAGAVSQRTLQAGTFMILKRQPCNLCNI